MRSCAWRSASLAGSCSSAMRSIDSVGSISRRRRSSASTRKISQTSAGASKYSRRSPGWCFRRTRRHDCNSFRPMLTLERENSSASAISSAFSRAGDEQQRVDLADGAIDAPAAAHLAEMRDELTRERRRWSWSGMGVTVLLGERNFQSFLKLLY